MEKLLRKKEHFVQIIEMAINLFPEYTDFKWGKNWDSDEIWFYDLSRNSYEIHWVEFCIFWIALKIDLSPAHLFRKLEEENTGEHIVDVLYSIYEQKMRK